jgi:CheY-like chemotaxis protein/anti-sigma regulatory factor (Ser/Thr protein kinase)
MAKRKARKQARRKHRRAPARAGKPCAKPRAKPPSPRALEAVLAGIAHDIRTPLTGIAALAELLATSDLGAREREWANAIKSGADHLAALASLIVDAAKAGATGLTLRDEPFSPRALAEAVGHGLAARAGNKDVKAEVAIADNLPALASGDALRLRAALENLVDNAVKFTNKGTVVFTAAAEEAERARVNLVFTVVDTGIGMDPREIKKLFRPFAQASESIARRYGGAGLGLVFVKRVAEAMQGSLDVTSTRGKGTTFRLSVPVKRMDAQPAIKPRGAQSAARPLAILCAEDNPYGRVVMKTIVSELGHRIDFVETGEAAVQAAASGSYDAVLMDVALSGIDGLEATRRIRALPGAAGQVAVIGISGRGDATDEAAARAAGMNFYFVKPVSPAKLAQALAALSQAQA